MTQSAEAMMPGPCIICGLSDYPLSAGGPTICPSCDCGDFGPAKIERQRKEIEQLRAGRDAYRSVAVERANDMAEVKRLTAEIERLKDRIDEHHRIFEPMHAEIKRLQELLRGTGANRYWEERWRDEKTDNERLRAALEPFAHNVDAVSLSATLGHITREDLWRARAALEHKP